MVLDPSKGHDRPLLRVVGYLDVLREVDLLVNCYLVIVELVVDGPQLSLSLGAQRLPLLELLLAIVDAVLRLENQLLKLLTCLAAISLDSVLIGHLLTLRVHGLSLTSSSRGGSVMHSSY